MGKRANNLLDEGDYDDENISFEKYMYVDIYAHIHLEWQEGFS